MEPSRVTSNSFHGLHRYQILGEIGEGAFGVVYRCKDRLTGEIIALKEFKSIISSQNYENSSEYENKVNNNISKFAHNRILCEIATLRRLCGQKHIVQLRDFFLHENRYYLALEYYPQSLLQFLEKSSNGIQMKIIQSCIYQIIQALDTCHSMGIIHRDIKPENILISGQDVDDIDVKLCDFGFARFIQQNSNNLKDGKQFCGDVGEKSKYGNRPLTSYVSTRWYRAPELLIRSFDYNTGIDVWAVGCIMAELIDGEPLFAGNSDIDQLYLIRNCIGRLDEKHQTLLESNKKLHTAFKKHITKGFMIGSDAKYNYGKYNANKHANYVVPPYQIPSLKERYGNKIDEIAFDFLNVILTMDPQKRPNCNQLLKHPFLASFNSNSKISKISNKIDCIALSFLSLDSYPSEKRQQLPIQVVTTNASSSELHSPSEKKEDKTLFNTNIISPTNISQKIQNLLSNPVMIPTSVSNSTNCTDNIENLKKKIASPIDDKTTAPSTPDDISTGNVFPGLYSFRSLPHAKVSLPSFPMVLPPPPPPPIRLLADTNKVKDDKQLGSPSLLYPLNLYSRSLRRIQGTKGFLQQSSDK
ncbi:protein kinase domain-containing protein [Cryptosporidium serpentis]